MPNKLTSFYAAIIAGVLGGCAAPRIDTPDQSFVSARELTAARLGEESQAHFQRGQFIDAELKLRQVLYFFPNAKNVRMNLAQVLLRNGGKEEGEVLYAQLAKDYPDSLELAIHRGRALYHAGYFDEARAVLTAAFDRALVETPGAAGLLRQDLALIAFRLGDEGSALCLSSEAWGEQQAVEMLVRHTRLLLGVGRAADALVLLTQRNKEHPGEKDPRLLQQWALAGVAGGELPAALERSRSAMERRETVPEFDAEIVALSNALEFKLKDSAAEPHEEEERDAPLELASEATLFWPDAALRLYEEWRASRPGEES